jgi:hypothetical protein
MSDVSQGLGWWIASDGKWYPPELHPSRQQTSAPVAPAVPETPAETDPAPASIPPYGAPRSRYVGFPTTNWPAPVAPTPYATVGPATSGLAPSGPAPSGPDPLGTPEPFLYSTPGPYGTPWPSGPLSGSDNGAPGKRRRRGYVGAIIALVIVVVAVSLVAVFGSNGPSYPGTWNPRVLSIVHFVEHERGLTFKHPVKVEFLDNAAFVKQVTAPSPDTTSEKASLKTGLGELRSLGMVHGNVNLFKSENQLQASGVVGLYMPEKKTVFVRGSQLTPFVRVTLAHELTHALQDQYFDLDTLGQSVPGDGSALTALIEGDAVRTQDAYEKTLSSADKQAYDKAQSKYTTPSKKTAAVPEVLSDIEGYPYAFGPAFIDNLVHRGGTGALNNAFRHPPVAEAQIIDPQAYPIDWKPKTVAAPSVPDGDEVTDPASPFGMLELFMVLGSRLGYGPAWSAVQGWQGDSSIAYDSHGTTCGAVTVAMKNSGRAVALTGALRQWSATVASLHAVIGRKGTLVSFRSCDPGPNGPTVPKMNPSAFDVLAVRAQLIDEFITDGYSDFALGACVSDSVIRFLGPARYSELLSSSLTASQNAQISAEIPRAADTCTRQGVR